MAMFMITAYIFKKLPKVLLRAGDHARRNYDISKGSFYHGLFTIPKMGTKLWKGNALVYLLACICALFFYFCRAIFEPWRILKKLEYELRV